MTKFIALFSLTLSLVALSICFCFISLDETTVSYNSFISHLGLIITALAFMVGSYFAFIAIRAYQHLSEIEKLVLKLSEIETSHNSMLKRNAEFLLQNIDHQLALENSLTGIKFEEHNTILDRKFDLYLLRARMSYIFPMLDQEIREGLIRELGAFGTNEDIPKLERIIQSSDPNSDLFNICQEAISLIEKEQKENK